MNWSNFLISTFPLVIQQYVDYYRDIDLNKTLIELQWDYGLPRIRSYDFIVVGAGTAGCLLSSKLSDKYTVLLLEEGGPPPPHLMVPYFYYWAYHLPSINTFVNSTPYMRTPRPGNVDRVEFISMGKMLGGSGSHNYNLYARGSPHDWDSFANVTGDASWNYLNMVRVFKGVEDYKGHLIHESDRKKWYGQHGPISIETAQPPYLQSWFDAGKEIGYPSNDPNAYQTPSISTRNGLKGSTYTAYVLKRPWWNPNLKVIPYSTAEEVLIKDGAAYGVAYFRHGIPQIALAKKEVIISAGTVATPILLTKSGIGPKDILKAAGIKPAIKEDKLPSEFPLVGHLGVDLLYEPGNTQEAIKAFPGVESVFHELENFFAKHRTGFFLRSGEAQAFITSRAAKTSSNRKWPDIQYIVSRNASLEGRGVWFSTFLTRPSSKGVVGFNTTAYKGGERDWAKLAIVDPQIFSHPKDKAIMVEGLKTMRKIVEGTTTFKKMNMTYKGVVPKRCRSLPFGSDAYWVCHTEEVGYVTHYVGTCRMGRVGDKEAVVGSKLRVRGVRNLRVVDSSILPYPVDAGTNPAVTVVAAKAAREILRDHENCPLGCKN